MAAINKNLAFSKRKPELLMDGGEVVEKRKKGRPRKDKMATPMAQPFTQVNAHRPTKAPPIVQPFTHNMFMCTSKFPRSQSLHVQQEIGIIE